MLKTFDEMYKIDVMPLTEKRDNIPYLPWPKVYQLLYENGATTVWHVSGNAWIMGRRKASSVI